MCGLLGASGAINAKTITALGCLISKRGQDSAGIAWKEGGELKVAKAAVSPLVAFPITLSGGIEQAAALGGPLIGHTREASAGAICDTTAHPFLVGRIAFAHNGLIRNDKDFGVFPVDSEALIYGIEAKDFSDYVGSIALVWIEDGRLHAYRKGNPLFRGSRDGAMYLASERFFLEQVGCWRVRELREGYIHRFNGETLEQVYSVPTNTVQKAPDEGKVLEQTVAPDSKEEPGLRVWERDEFGNLLRRRFEDSLEEDAPPTVPVLPEPLDSVTAELRRPLSLEEPLDFEDLEEHKTLRCQWCDNEPALIGYDFGRECAMVMNGYGL